MKFDMRDHERDQNPRDPTGLAQARGGFDAPGSGDVQRVENGLNGLSNASLPESGTVQPAAGQAVADAAGISATTGATTHPQIRLERQFGTAPAVERARYCNRQVPYRYGKVRWCPNRAVEGSQYCTSCGRAVARREGTS